MDFITVSQYAELHNLSERTVRNWCSAGKMDGAFLSGKKYTWHRWVLTSQENATSAVGFQIQEFGLFDGNGMRQNYGLELNSNYASLQPGQVAYATDKIAVPTAADRNIDKLFDDIKTDYGYYGQMRAPNASSGTQTPVRGNPYSWIPIVMRLTNGAPDAVMYDVVFYQASSHARSPTSYFVDGSVDGVHWDRLSTVNAINATAADYWYYNAESFGAGGKLTTSYMNGCTIDSAPASLFNVLNNATAVSVAAGAVLAAEGDVTVPGLAADLSDGCGTISNFTFAASGTVYLENMPAGLQAASLDWTLLDCDGVANVSNWKVAVDGEETDRWRMQVSQSGKISVCRLGFRMIIR